MDQGNDNRPSNGGVPVLLVAQPVGDDVLSLRDMLFALFRHWKLIVIITGISTAIGVVVAYTTPPVFQASTSLVEPSLNDFSKMEIFAEAMTPPPALGNPSPVLPIYTPKALFHQFIKALNSKSIQREYFLHHGGREKLIPNERNRTKVLRAFRDFSDSLVWTSDDDTLTLQGGDPKITADVLNDFVKQAAKMIRQNMVDNLNASKRIRIASLKSKIARLQVLSADRRRSRIAQLEGALSIAQHLGIQTFTRTSGSSSGGKHNTAMTAHVSTGGPLYLRGSKALEAEIARLKEQKYDDVPTPQLNGAQQELVQLEQPSITSDDFRLMRVDELAYPPVNRLKPIRKQIAGIALLIGLVLGIVLAVVYDPIKRANQ